MHHRQHQHGHERQARETGEDLPTPEPDLELRMAPEEHQHRGRGQRHQQDHAQRGQVGQPGKQLQDRIGIQRCENQHHHGRDQALQDRAHMRALVHPMGGAQLAVQQAVTADGVEVTGGGVVKGQQAGIDADHEQHADNLGQLRADKVVGHAIDKRGRVLQGLQHRHDLVRTHAHHHRPHRQRVETADQQHRAVGRNRNGALRVPGFFTVDGGGLEADKGSEAEQQAD